MEKWLGELVPKLGFGLMRLPTANNEIDIKTLCDMVDAFLGAGFTYFDTAFGYMNGKSETAIKEALISRYPRDKFLLATKLPPWELKVKEDMERVFATQLHRTGTGYFDYYLIHSLGSGNIKPLNDYDAWSFLMEKKEKGLVRHIGFSFHDTADFLDEVLTAHPETEFVQLQINYADWEDEGVQSRRCYETARRHGVSVIIMEPVKGGALSVLPDEARALLAAARPGMSAASWAMRYCGSMEGIVNVLSGMSTPQQMADNIRTMRDFTPLTEADRNVIGQVKDILAAIPTIPCTGCNYCVEKCPQDIPIPGILDGENSRRVYAHANKGHYAFVTRAHGKASDCVGCGVCEERCPQHLPIMDLLKGAAAAFE